MKLSSGFFITRRENPKDESILASKLLIKSGMILKNANGIYSYLPMGLKVLENIKKIIRKEMIEIHAEEVLVPVMSNYTESDFGIEEFNFLDRDDNRLKLFSSAKELFAYLASSKVKSYRDLHFSLFQINHNFRDEEHPEYGLVRKKEFYTLEAYSFDADEGGEDVSYDKMYLAFKKIFNKLGLDSLVVRGNEGELCEEFQVISPEGDNKVVRCTNCTYASNVDDASSGAITTMKEVIPRELELIKTPGLKSIRDLSEYLDVFESRILKTLVIKVDGKLKMILLKGDSSLNVKKLKQLFKTSNIKIPTIYELEKLGTSVGYIGPIGIDIEIIADNEVKSMNNFICGSNKTNYHYTNANYGRDFKINRFADLKLFDEKSVCPKCKNECEILDGIEVGQITKLGKKYSKDLKISYMDEINKKQYAYVGSYTIGLDRVISAIVEKHNDEKGIIWPIDVAPYKVGIIISNVNDDEISKYANNLYEKLETLGIDTILDDRKESIGVKFNDLELMGIPIIVVVGNKLEKNVVEVNLRQDGERKDVKTNKIIEYIQNILEKK